MSKVVCVLGMHRSGTSCLAGSLEEAGLFLGEVNTAATFNKKGTREDDRIWVLHNQILADNGGSWPEPPDRIVWSDAHRARRDAIIESYASQPCWGFKDPRTLLMFGFWEEAIPDLRLVGTFRHPSLVAGSLRDREGRNLPFWVDLWTRYNTALLTLARQRSFPLLRFDVAESTYIKTLKTAVGMLGLVPPASPAFFDPDLRHQAGDVAIPEEAASIYAALCRLAIDPEPLVGGYDL
jgi:hypothetical protein